MAATIKSRVPAKAKKGDIIEIKAQVTHDMESGQRKDAAGKVIPRRIINKFVCTWNAEVIVSSDWNTAMSANPFVSFFAVATESGQIKLAFHDDSGEIHEQVSEIVVE